jgi:SET domain-containing protein
MKNDQRIMKNAPRKVLKIASESSPFRLQIARSAIHRRGVFAQNRIPRNRKVIEYAGERLTWPQTLLLLKNIWRFGAPPNLYLIRLNRHWIINGAAGGSGAQFINHSCDPNLSRRRMRGHLFFFSTRNIRKGEELTLDYQFRSDVPKTPCSCGSPKCRGTINVK